MRTLFGAFCADEDDVELRCTIVLSLFVAGHFSTVDHGQRTQADVIELALRRLLSPWSTGHPGLTTS